MTGEEIANTYGWTRQYVSNTLKTAMEKIYLQAKKEFPNYTPFEICNAIREGLKINTYEDINTFFELFPKKIREEIFLSLKNEEFKRRRSNND